MPDSSAVARGCWLRKRARRPDRCAALPRLSAISYLSPPPTLCQQGDASCLGGASAFRESEAASNASVIIERGTSDERRRCESAHCPVVSRPWAWAWAWTGACSKDGVCTLWHADAFPAPAPILTRSRARARCPGPTQESLSVVVPMCRLYAHPCVMSTCTAPSCVRYRCTLVSLRTADMQTMRARLSDGGCAIVHMSPVPGSQEP